MHLLCFLVQEMLMYEIRGLNNYQINFIQYSSSICSTPQIVPTFWIMSFYTFKTGHIFFYWIEEEDKLINIG